MLPSRLYKKLSIILTLLMVINMFASGIAFASEEELTVKLLASNPADQALDVSVSLPEITLSYDVNGLLPSLNYQNIQFSEADSGEPVDCVTQIRGGDTLVLVLSDTLKPLTSYYVGIPGAALKKEIAENGIVIYSMGESFYFTTGLGEITFSVSPGTLELPVGQDRQLDITGPIPGDADVTYQSGSELVATVSGSGLITAVGIGATTITATATKAMYADRTATVEVTVVPGTIEFEVSPSPVNLAVGSSEQLTVSNFNTTGVTLEYISGDTGIATVSDTGEVAGVSPGSTTVTVKGTKPNYSDELVTVVVNVGVGPITFNVSPSPVDIPVDGSQQLSISGLNTSGVVFEYTSGDTSIATVSGTGLVAGVSQGDTTVTVKGTKPGYADKYVTVDVNVSPAQIDFNVTPSPVNTVVGGSQQLSVNNFSTTGVSLEYTSSNPGFATVSNTGLVAGVAQGTAMVTVRGTKPGYIEKTVNVEVNVGLGTINFNVQPSPVILEEGLQEQLIISDLNPSGASFAYQSGNQSVATVSQSGLITAVAQGVTTVSVTASKAGFTSTVKQVSVEVVEDSVSPMIVEVKSTIPADGAFNISESISEIRALFSVTIREPLSIQGVFDQIELKETNSNIPVPINCSVSGKYLLINPGAELKPDTLYTVLIPGWAVEGYVGMDPLPWMPNFPYAFNFTTGHTIEIDVTQPVSLLAGQTVPLEVVTDPAGATLQYSSGSPDIAEVDAGGNITGICEGTAYITVTASKAGFLSSSVTIPVTVGKGAIMLDVTGPGTLVVGQTAQLNPVTSPVSGVTLSYSSDNTGVAEVDNSGLIRAICNGTAEITVTASKVPCCNAATTTCVVAV
ncbi:MAG: Ig-like domain-containing protein, partial [Desulfocucumaceae bacterium]